MHVLRALHGLGLCFVLMLCIYLLFFANPGSPRVEPIAVGLLCGTYALAQLILLVRGRLRWWSASFYVLCPLLAFATSWFGMGFDKNWAPNTVEELRGPIAAWGLVWVAAAIASVLSLLPGKRTKGITT